MRSRSAFSRLRTVADRSHPRVFGWSPPPRSEPCCQSSRGYGYHLVILELFFVKVDCVSRPRQGEAARLQDTKSRWGPVRIVNKALLASSPAHVPLSDVFAWAIWTVIRHHSDEQKIICVLQCDFDQHRKLPPSSFVDRQSLKHGYSYHIGNFVTFSWPTADSKVPMVEGFQNDGNRPNSTSKIHFQYSFIERPDSTFMRFESNIVGKILEGVGSDNSILTLYPKSLPPVVGPLHCRILLDWGQRGANRSEDWKEPCHQTVTKKVRSGA